MPAYTTSAVASLEADRTLLLELAAGLGPDEWAAPSGCDGWSVQDVLAHLGSLYWLVVDPSALPDTTGVPTEQAQDLVVESRRSWTTGQVVADYEDVSAKALSALAGLAGQTFEMDLGDLGTFAAEVVPHAFAFDHHLHLRADLFAPRGPLTGPVPAANAVQLDAALLWVEAALPQQNRSVLAELPGEVELALSGPAARTWFVGPAGLGHEPVGEVVARVESDGGALLRWATGRGTWQELGATGSGDDAALAAVRQLRSF